MAASLFYTWVIIPKYSRFLSVSSLTFPSGEIFSSALNVQQFFQQTLYLQAHDPCMLLNIP